MTITLSALQKQRRDTAANWTAEDPTLLAGEIGIESDTGYWKVGDGSTAWTSLAYVSGLGGKVGVPDGTAAAPAIYFADDTNTGIYSPGADQLAISTNGTGRLFVDSSGRVGIGTASVDGQLLVETDTNKDIRIRNASHNTLTSGLGSAITFSRASDGIADLSAVFGWNNGGLALAARQGMVFATGGGSGYTATTEAVRIDSSGRVGVGTSSVTGNLHVKGNDGINIERSDGANQWSLIPSNGATGSTNLRLYERVSGKEVINITTGGAVGIGTTSPSASSLLDVSSTTQGFLPPRMTGTQRDAISSPAAGLMVYNTTTNKLNFYNGSAWEAVTSA
mgnify:CR=1 FL=1